MEKTKEITLAGEVFILQETVLRQRRVITPIWQRVLPVVKKHTEEKNILDLPAQTWDDMIEIVYQGMVRILPHLTRDSLLDMKISLAELIYAVPVVVSLSGFEPKEENAPGEQIGETQNSPTIGTSTSTT